MLKLPYKANKLQRNVKVTGRDDRLDNNFFEVNLTEQKKTDTSKLF